MVGEYPKDLCPAQGRGIRRIGHDTGMHNVKRLHNSTTICQELQEKGFVRWDVIRKNVGHHRDVGGGKVGGTSLAPNFTPHLLCCLLLVLVALQSLCIFEEGSWIVCLGLGCEVRDEASLTSVD